MGDNYEDFKPLERMDVVIASETATFNCSPSETTLECSTETECPFCPFKSTDSEDKTGNDIYFKMFKDIMDDYITPSELEELQQFYDLSPAKYSAWMINKEKLAFYKSIIDSRRKSGLEREVLSCSGMDHIYHVNPKSNQSMMQPVEQEAGTSSVQSSQEDVNLNQQDQENWISQPIQNRNSFLYSNQVTANSYIPVIPVQYPGLLMFPYNIAYIPQPFNQHVQQNFQMQMERNGRCVFTQETLVVQTNNQQFPRINQFSGQAYYFQQEVTEPLGNGIHSFIRQIVTHQYTMPPNMYSFWAPRRSLSRNASINSRDCTEITGDSHNSTDS